MITVMKHRAHGFALALSCLLAACTTAPLPVDEQTDVWRGAEEVIASGYRGISDKYIEPMNVGEFALDGIRGFTAIDPALGLDVSESSVFLTYSGRRIFSATAPDGANVRQWAKLTADMAHQARRYSIEMRTADAEKLYEAVFDGVLAKIDLFSRYAGAEAARRNRARRDGFGGIGIRYRIENKTVQVVKVTPGKPADRSGIQANDIITHIDGQATDGLTTHQITARIRGATHTTVSLTVVSEGQTVAKEHRLTRTHIVPVTVTEKRLDDVLYYKISSFNQDTSHALSSQLERAIAEMGDRLKGVILDLRGNPGGLLKQSVKAADLFLTQGNIISTRGRHADSLHNYEAGGRDLTGGLPLLLLIDGKSASAAEIVAAALQDRERAVLIGTSSYGKGTVQTVLRLPNDGEITLTWSRLVAPSGYSLHGLGVRPELCTRRDKPGIVKLVDSSLQSKLVTNSIFHQWRTAGIREQERRQKLRDSCPPERRDTDRELNLARHLISNPGEYAQVMNLSAAPHQAHK